MKKSLLFPVFALLMGLVVASCNRENINATSDDLFAEAVQLSAARTSAATDTVTKQKCRGKLTEIKAADLPKAVTDYINANFAGSEIKFAGKDANGMIVVGIELADDSHKGLVFNADGTFNKALEKYGKRAKLTKVEISALPKAITDHIASKYAGYTAKRAGKNDTGEFFVMVTKEGEQPKVLQYDANGVFKEESTPPAHPGGPRKGKK
jgi:hypothetical protein